MGAPGTAAQPWQIVSYGDGDSLVIHDARGDWRVCFMATAGDHGSVAQIRANAHQIAASGEMYDALEAAEALFHHTFAMDGTVHKQVKAALALARGEKAA